MDLCRTIIVALLALAAFNLSERASYDAVHGLRIAAAPTATVRG